MKGPKFYFVIIYLLLNGFCRISRRIYVKWGLAHAFLHQAKLNLSFAGYFVFFSPEDVGVFADQKWRNAASKVDVPVDEEDNSDVQ